ncbi:hypothetical protein SERLA73DRAFT_158744 [Serpula lacrymans var. lacrymans S7.3]|uniref:Uncharacterized protein n=2 Tax=Serpula lacrymans var. lacrymans (strain S7.3) TaxID=936435 RepID=F8PPJ8_SERL3|nr:hypothetical protein SERLA73DRAFT_158744 [Serpula lacrymans var. lacrymans S7.3]
MNVLLKKKKLEPPVHHLVQIRQFHGLTNGLVVLDHLIKRGRERSSSNLEQSTDWRRKRIGSGDIRNGGGANKMRRRRVEVTNKWIRMGTQKRLSASGDVKICQNAKTRKVPDGKAKIGLRALVTWLILTESTNFCSGGMVFGKHREVMIPRAIHQNMSVAQSARILAIIANKQNHSQQ